MRGLALACAGGAFVLLLAISSLTPRATAAEMTELKAGPGRDLTAGSCMACHSLEYIPANAPAMNRAAWQKTVQKMRERFGAPISDAQAKQILDYLDANYSGKAS